MKMRLRGWDAIWFLPDIAIFNLDQGRTLNLLFVFWLCTGVGSPLAHTNTDTMLGPGTSQHETLMFDLD